MGNQDLVKSISEAARKNLADLESQAKRITDAAVATVRHANLELDAVVQAASGAPGGVGAFLGAAVVLVGVSERPMEPVVYQSPTHPVLFLQDEQNYTGRIHLHADAGALSKMKGNYKAIVLLYPLG